MPRDHDIELTDVIQIVLRRLEAFQPHEQAVILRASGRLLDRLETKDGRRG